MASRGRMAPDPSCTSNQSYGGFYSSSNRSHRGAGGVGSDLPSLRKSNTFSNGVSLPNVSRRTGQPLNRTAPAAAGNGYGDYASGRNVRTPGSRRASRGSQRGGGMGQGQSLYGNSVRRSSDIRSRGSAQSDSGLEGSDWRRKTMAFNSSSSNGGGGAGYDAASGMSEWGRKTMNFGDAESRSGSRRASRQGVPHTPNTAEHYAGKGAGAGAGAGSLLSPRNTAANGSPIVRRVGASAVPNGGAANQSCAGAHSIGGKYPAGMFVGGRSKKENQDDYFVSGLGTGPPGSSGGNRKNPRENPVLHGGDFIAGALDGHGMHGKTVSNFARQKLQARLLSERALNMPAEAYGDSSGNIDPQVEEDVRKAIAFSVVGTDREIEHAGINSEESGTTSVTAIRRGNNLWLANVGDSRCILAEATGGGGVRSVELTSDHKPDRPDEKERVHRNRGFVEPSRLGGIHGRGPFMGPHRVWIRRQQEGGLAMSRSLGDHKLVKVGVIPDPEISRHQVRPGKDKFIVLASDGVWDHMDNQKVVQLAAKYMHNANPDPKKASEVICDHARKAWMTQGGGYIDDITAVVVGL